MLPVEWSSPVVLVSTAVLVIVLIRLWLGGVVFAPRWARTWNVARTVLAPIVQQLIYRRTPLSVKIENEAEAVEWVGVIEPTDEPLAVVVDDVRPVEIPLLSGVKTSPDGVEEHETLVWYYGPSPFPTAPRWLRRYQVHVFTFRSEGEVSVYAHAEANPWRPDLWADHLNKGQSFSVPEGVMRADAALDEAGVEWVDRVYMGVPNPHEEARA
jgi:hypothetical protein